MMMLLMWYFHYVGCVGVIFEENSRQKSKCTNSLQKTIGFHIYVCNEGHPFVVCVILVVFRLYSSSEGFVPLNPDRMYKKIRIRSESVHLVQLSLCNGKMACFARVSRIKRSLWKECDGWVIFSLNRRGTRWEIGFRCCAWENAVFNKKLAVLLSVVLMKCILCVMQRWRTSWAAGLMLLSCALERIRCVDPHSAMEFREIMWCWSSKITRFWRGGEILVTGQLMIRLCDAEYLFEDGLYFHRRIVD